MLSKKPRKNLSDIMKIIHLEQYNTDFVIYTVYFYG